MKPDYQSYTLEELNDVKSNIDKDAYPERYKELLQEIMLRGKSEPKVIIKEVARKGIRKPSNKEKFISSSIMLIITVVCLYYGKIPGKHDGWSMEEDPYFFWGTLLFCVGFAINQLLTLEKSQKQSGDDT